MTAPSPALTRADVNPDPILQFDSWYRDAQQSPIRQPEAMTLATVSTDHAPTQRTVLLKHFSADGFVFFTNHGSRKARHMRDNTAISALFPWYLLQRQVIIEGRVDSLDAAESEAYFHSRPRESQLAAWASRQSEAISSREVLERQMAEVTERFGDGPVPLPEFWGGYRIRPDRMEFWQGGKYRLHDRILYVRGGESGKWEISRLSP